MSFAPSVPMPILRAHQLEHAAMRSRGVLGQLPPDNTPSTFGKSSQDLLLRSGSVWASRMMEWARRYPERDRPARLENALNRIEPGMGSQVRRIGERMMKRGMMADAALHRALQYAFADGFVDSILRIGRDARAGRQPGGRNMIAMQGTGDGLEGLGTGDQRSPEQITGDIVSGIVCSDGVASLVGHAAGVNDTTKSAGDRQLAAGLTETGFTIARAISGATGNPCASATPTTEVPVPAPVEPTTPTWVVPAAVGAGVLLIGGVLLIALK